VPPLQLALCSEEHQEHQLQLSEALHHQVLLLVAHQLQEDLYSEVQQHHLLDQCSAGLLEVAPVCLEEEDRQEGDSWEDWVQALRQVMLVRIRLEVDHLLEVQQVASLEGRVQRPLRELACLEEDLEHLLSEEEEVERFPQEVEVYNRRVLQVLLSQLQVSGQLLHLGLRQHSEALPLLEVLPHLEQLQELLSVEEPLLDRQHQVEPHLDPQDLVLSELEQLSPLQHLDQWLKIQEEHLEDLEQQRPHLQLQLSEVEEEVHLEEAEELSELLLVEAAAHLEEEPHRPEGHPSIHGDRLPSKIFMTKSENVPAFSKINQCRFKR